MSRKSPKNSNLAHLAFLGLAVISAIVCILSLRANNEHMAVLRQDVFNADKNNGNVGLALSNLQAYVTTNMNTSLDSGKGSVYPPIQLQYSYQRQLQAESSGVASSNSSLYTQAEDYCQAQVPNGFSGRYRVPCITQYINSHGINLPTLSDATYKFDFITPAWSPDLAGFSLLATIIFFICFLFLFIYKMLAKRL